MEMVGTVLAHPWFFSSPSLSLFWTSSFCFDGHAKDPRAESNPAGKEKLISQAFCALFKMHLITARHWLTGPISLNNS
jgi:hypothetical protein